MTRSLRTKKASKFGRKYLRVSELRLKSASEFFYIAQPITGGQEPECRKICRQANRVARTVKCFTNSMFLMIRNMEKNVIQTVIAEDFLKSETAFLWNIRSYRTAPSKSCLKKMSTLVAGLKDYLLQLRMSRIFLRQMFSCLS